MILALSENGNKLQKRTAQILIPLASHKPSGFSNSFRALERYLALNFLTLVSNMDIAKCSMVNVRIVELRLKS